jgi:hypothetical protein
MRTFPKRSPLRLGARAKEPVGAIRVPGLVAPTRPSQPALAMSMRRRVPSAVGTSRRTMLSSSRLSPP